MAEPALTSATTTVHANACWRRIGVQGDRSCPALAEHVHCRHCPVHQRAAAAMLDRLPVSVADYTVTPVGAAPALPCAAEGETLACMTFRVGSEWLALPAGALEEVALPLPRHSLPHQRNPAVLGLLGLRGRLLIGFSLGTLLGLPAETAADDRGPTRRRTLILRWDHDAAALPVDETGSVERVALSALRPLPATVAGNAAHLTRALLPWRERTVGLLDVERLRLALQRSLA